MKKLSSGDVLVGVNYMCSDYYETKVLVKGKYKFVINLNTYYLGDRSYYEGVWRCNTGSEIITGVIDENKDVWELNNKLNSNNNTHKELIHELINSLNKLADFTYLESSSVIVKAKGNLSL